jgi:hypothetical protein
MTQELNQLRYSFANLQRAIYRTDIEQSKKHKQLKDIKSKILKSIYSAANKNGEFYKETFQGDLHKKFDSDFSHDSQDPQGNNLLLLAISKAVYPDKAQDMLTYIGQGNKFDVSIVDDIVSEILVDAQKKLNTDDFSNFINFVNQYNHPKYGGTLVNSPLTLAIKSGNLPKSIDLLIKMGADVNLVPSSKVDFVDVKHTPLDIAMIQLRAFEELEFAPHTKRVVELLKEHGATEVGNFGTLIYDEKYEKVSFSEVEGEKFRTIDQSDDSYPRFLGCPAKWHIVVNSLRATEKGQELLANVQNDPEFAKFGIDLLQQDFDQYFTPELAQDYADISEFLSTQRDFSAIYQKQKNMEIYKDNAGLFPDMQWTGIHYNPNAFLVHRDARLLFSPEWPSIAQEILHNFKANINTSLAQEVVESTSNNQVMISPEGGGVTTTATPAKSIDIIKAINKLSHVIFDTKSSDKSFANAHITEIKSLLHADERGELYKLKLDSTRQEDSYIFDGKTINISKIGNNLLSYLLSKSIANGLHKSSTDEDVSSVECKLCCDDLVFDLSTLDEITAFMILDAKSKLSTEEFLTFINSEAAIAIALLSGSMNQTVKALVENGADLDVKSWNKISAMEIAEILLCASWMESDSMQRDKMMPIISHYDDNLDSLLSHHDLVEFDRALASESYINMMAHNMNFSRYKFHGVNFDDFQL